MLIYKLVRQPLFHANIKKLKKFSRPPNNSHQLFVYRVDADRKEHRKMTGKELEKIYNEAYKAVYWTAMSLLKNEADAEDIVQDTFVSFIESYSDLTDTAKTTALLKKIAANKCLDRIKLAKTDNMDEEFFDNVEAVPEDFLPDSIVESDEMRRIVMDIINNSLSEDVRRTLILFYFDEMSTKEIAEALGVPQGTVLRRLNYARNKIKKEVEKYEEENDTKLFGMAIPFLSKLFIKESEQVVLKPMPASLCNLSASVKAPSNGAGIKASAEVIKKGTDIMKTKILIGSIAGVVAVGATVGIIAGVASKKADSKDKPVNRTTEERIIDDDDDDNKKSSSDSSDKDETKDTAKKTTTTKFVNDGNTVYCDLSGMSATDIYDNLMNTKNFAQGTVYEDYFKKYDQGNGAFFRNENTDDSWDYENDDSMAKITRIGLVRLYEYKPNVKTANDTVLTVDNRSYIYITFEVDDLDKAYEVYNKFMEYFATIGTASERMDITTLHGSVKTEDGNFFSVTLQTDDEGPYRMSVEIPCNY